MMFPGWIRRKEVEDFAKRVGLEFARQEVKIQDQQRQIDQLRMESMQLRKEVLGG